MMKYQELKQSLTRLAWDIGLIGPQKVTQQMKDKAIELMHEQIQNARRNINIAHDRFNGDTEELAHIVEVNQQDIESAWETINELAYGEKYDNKWNFYYAFGTSCQ